VSETVVSLLTSFLHSPSDVRDAFCAAQYAHSEAAGAAWVGENMRPRGHSER
jgi:hypothetical protein